ncbi:hypothetical protein [Bordetella tumulicola]|uniref:hypothetical protein n=1 Tax=Bordetella tumulicola TaxID=1649133 RepID=UPI0039EE7793
MNLRSAPLSRLCNLMAMGTLVSVLVAGCASSLPVPREPIALTTPRMLHVTEQRPGEAVNDAMLVVQSEGSGTRWSLFDPLGAPRARQILEDGQWRTDGFLPPNAKARSLFAALIFAWTPQAELASRYGASNVTLADHTRILNAQGKPLVSVTPMPGDTLRIELNDGTRWQVMPLKEKP